MRMSVGYGGPARGQARELGRFRPARWPEILQRDHHLENGRLMVAG